MKPDFLFDFGAVVFRWEPLALLRQALPRRAINEEAAQAMAQTLFQGYAGAWGAFDRGELEGEALVSALQAQTGWPAADLRAIIAAVPGHLEPLPDTVAWLHELKAAGHRLFFLSNMPRPYADHLERSHGFLSLFQGGVFSGRAGLAKPDAAIFEHVMAECGLEASRTVFLDDHPANITAAQGLGFQAVQFTSAAQAQADLRRAGVWPATA